MEFINLQDPSRLLQTVDVIDISVDPDPDTHDNSFDIWGHLPDVLHINSTASGTVHGATDVEVSAVITSLRVNAVIFVVLLLLYELAFRAVPSVYRNNRPSDIVLPKSMLPLNWVPTILRVSWSQVRNVVGLDGYFFLRYIRFCFQITSVTGLWGIVILWPVYASGGNDAHGWYHLSMANLQSGSWYLWFPTGFMCFLTSYLIFLLNEEYKHYVECRMEFLAKGDSHVHPQQRYTLLVEDIPNELRSDNALHDYFNELFPGHIHASCIVLNVPDLVELYDRRDKVVRRLEKCQAILEVLKKRPCHRVGAHKYMDVFGRRVGLLEDDPRLPPRGEKVDSIQYYTKYLTILNENVAEKQREKMKLASTGENSRRASEWISHSLGLLGASPSNIFSSEGDGLMISSTGTLNLSSGLFLIVRKLGVDFFVGGLATLHRPFDVVVDTMVGRTLTSTGFITFTDLASVTCAVRAPLTHEAGVLSVQMAPDPRDVEWNNAHIDKSWSEGRQWTVDFFLALGAVLWSVPVAAVQALANLNSLSTIPGLSWVTHATTSDFAAFLNGYLPVLALMGLIAALPPFFEWIASKVERRKSKSDTQHSVLKRFFYYQLANVYVTVTAGSILDSLAEILDHPSNAFTILGISLPTVVGYFVMFLFTKILAGLPLTLLNVGPLLNRILGSLLCRERIMSQRELEEEYKPIPMRLGRQYPNQLLVVVIMFTYATISPVILPVGALYFLAAFVVYKKQLLLVYSSTYESGGVFFPTACYRTMVGLVAAQVTLIGYTVLRQGYYQPMVLLPLTFYTVTMMSVFKQLYKDPGQYLSLERAVDLDKKRAENVADAFDENVYRQPILVFKDLEQMPHRSPKGSDFGTGGGAPLDGTEKAV
ncbi:Cytosolic domain of 10TM putative phosphate transporter [Fragilaria crotonensis]|nr:Cytosolic domain of 10TM putative phosphate transporter [Fragilaria crotonensis]